MRPEFNSGISICSRYKWFSVYSLLLWIICRFFELQCNKGQGGNIISFSYDTDNHSHNAFFCDIVWISINNSLVMFRFLAANSWIGMVGIFSKYLSFRSYAVQPSPLSIEYNDINIECILLYIAWFIRGTSGKLADWMPFCDASCSHWGQTNKQSIVHMNWAVSIVNTALEVNDT